MYPFGGGGGESQVTIIQSLIISIIIIDFIHACMHVLLHSASLGSGSHCPFPMHVDVLGPMGVNAELLHPKVT